MRKKAADSMNQARERPLIGIRRNARKTARHCRITDTHRIREISKFIVLNRNKRYAKQISLLQPGSWQDKWEVCPKPKKPVLLFCLSG